MLRTIFGTPQHYPWGDRVSIPALLGLPADNNTWAELWFGTHHVAPSHLDSADGPLLSQSAGDMDMLVKLLAAGQPLSLQTHPTREQATAGFARENAAGIELSASHRMYKDASDKPEILVALTPFEAMCGFQDMPEIIALFAKMNWHDEHDVLSREGIRRYMQWCFEQSTPPVLDDCPQWLKSIATIYPHDPGLRVAPLLHHVVLSPGEAVVLPAGNLHAYISGCGLEVMNSSDNVVRAGFTTKHIDVAELLAIVDTTPLKRPVVTPDSDGNYPSPSDAFSVQRITSNGHISFAAEQHQRIIFGPFSPQNNQSPAQARPAMYFLAAGDSGDLSTSAGDNVWVCRQR